MNNAHVSLAVFDFGDNLSVVTDVIGISPTEGWIKGDAMPNHPTAKRNHSRWVLASPLPKTESVENHVLALVLVLEQRREELGELVRRYSCEIQCALYCEGATAGVQLSPELIGRVARLGLGIDFDLYYIAE